MTAQEAYRRARRWFWICTGVAVLAVGGLSQALGGPDGPLTALATAVSGIVAAAFLVQAARIQRALGPAPRQLDGHSRRPRRRSAGGSP